MATRFEQFKEGLTAERMLAIMDGCYLEDKCDFCPAREYCREGKGKDLSCPKAFFAWAADET